MYEIIECNDKNENNMIYLQKSAKNHCKKYNIFGKKDVFWFNSAYSNCALNKSESPHTGASHPYLEKMYTPMWYNQQFYCIKMTNVNNY